MSRGRGASYSALMRPAVNPRVRLQGHAAVDERYETGFAKQRRRGAPEAAVGVGYRAAPHDRTAPRNISRIVSIDASLSSGAKKSNRSSR